MKCPVCSAERTRHLGRLQPYRDVATEIFDCPTCGSRFAPHEPEVYQRLHRSGAGAYANHEVWAAETATDLAAGRLGSLEKRLRRSPKQRFLLDTLADREAVDPLLEVGCSRGQLSAFLLARGRHLLGMDVAAEAVAAARNRFGDHFVEPGDPRVEAEGPYGAIFHLGTVGCVAAPFEFTCDLLGKLRCGGLLIFNAPNAAACRADGRLWVLGTPPPDLVTLFTADAWREVFPEAARRRGLEIEISVRERRASGAEYAHRRWVRGDPPPRPELYSAGPGMLAAGPGELSPPRARLPRLVRRGAVAAFDALAGLGALPERPAETGLEVVIVRRDGKS